MINKRTSQITVSYQRKITPYEINVNFGFKRSRVSI